MLFERAYEGRGRVSRVGEVDSLGSKPDAAEVELVRRDTSNDLLVKRWTRAARRTLYANRVETVCAILFITPKTEVDGFIQLVDILPEPT